MGIRRLTASNLHQTCINIRSLREPPGGARHCRADRGGAEAAAKRELAVVAARQPSQHPWHPWHPNVSTCPILSHVNGKICVGAENGFS